MTSAVSFAASLAAVAALSTVPALAQARDITIDFEGTTSFSSVNDYYNGGTDGAGASGTNYGVSFSSATLALSNDVLDTYYTNAPTSGAVMFSFDESAVMNVAAGITGAVSFFYSAATATVDAVTIYSGLNGTGTVLATYSLSANATNGCSDSAFCSWEQVSLAFSGIAQSVSFTSAGQVAFDNISITAVPEPQTYALMAMGLVALAMVRRQRRG